MTHAAAAPKLRKIACLGFDWRAEVSLRETLALLRGRTRDEWHYSDELNADAVVYESSNVLAQALVRRSAESGRQVFFPSSGDDQHDMVLRYPFGASRLIHCLDSASQRLGSSGAFHDLDPRPAHAASLCQRLDDMLRDPRTVAVAIRSHAHVGLLKRKEQQLHWPVALNLEELAPILAGEVEIRALGAGDAAVIAELESSMPQSSPAEAFLWAIGISRSSGTLLHRLQAAQAYRLRRWPNFGVIGRRSADIRCASLLTQRALSPAHLATMAGMPLSTLSGFLNASALCGLLQDAQAPVAQAATRPAAAPDSMVFGMLRRIRQAFAMAG